MTAAAKPPSQKAAMLPALREDLVIESAGSFLSGAPSWLIHDPMRNRFFRIGQPTLELLTLWGECSVDEFSNLASRAIGRSVEREEIEGLVKFLFSNHLTDVTSDASYATYSEQEKAGKKGMISALMHNYLFFRIPLFNPQKILDTSWPYIGFLFTRGAVVGFAILMVLALYLVSRQWEVFTSTFLAFLTFEGAAFYAISLVLIKFLHEFGHAFMAKKYDVPVPIIGVALLVLFPVLYTDTTAAVRLKQRRQRLLIDCAGIFTEFAIAILATLFWVFLPDGPLRSIAFTTATLSWTLSLLVNLNPFMRFDGYYILSDALGLENLQERSFGFARWRMREILFKPKNEAPEILDVSMRRFLIYHAWGTWIYRFFLFLGIALLVYSFFIKIVGIILFIVEILWFILLPIWREVKFWWLNKGSYKTMRSLISFSIVLTALAVFFLPWSTRVDAPAVMKAANEFQIYPPLDGKLKVMNLQERQSIREGEILLQLSSPKLDADIRISDQRKQLLQTRMSRAGSNEIELASLMILRQELETETQNLNGLLLKKEGLIVHAPFDGVLTNVDPELHPNQWISKTAPVSILIDKSSVKLTALVKSDSIERITVGQSGYFIPDGFVGEKLPIRIMKIADIAEVNLTELALADIEGGQIPVALNQDGLPQPHGTWFTVELSVEELPDDFELAAMMRGLAVIDGEPRSYAASVFRQIASVLIRESGF